MKNYLCSGERINVTIPSGGLTGGDLYLLGSKVVVVVDGGIETDVVSAATEGVFTVPKETGAITIGQKLYLKAGAKTVTTVATDNAFAGYAYAAAGSSDATAQLLVVDNPASTIVIPVQAASTASTVAGAVADLNTLIASLKTAGLMASA